jgi:Mg2+-importing ATPase
LEKIMNFALLKEVLRDSSAPPHRPPLPATCIAGIAIPDRGQPRSACYARANAVAAAKSDAGSLLKTLDTHAAGLNESQADAIRERVGPNEVEHEKPLRWWLHLWYCYKNPFNLLLSLLAVVSYVRT